MIKRLFFPFVLLTVFSFYSFAQTRARQEINIPDILGFKTLKCDFHMHTVFSDGLVWPTIRAEEAWRQGLDAIALTDHLEYIPHKDDVKIDYNRPYEIAKPTGDELDIIVIKGSEITRGMPPGHCNAIFLQDASKLKQDDWKQAFREAKKQGAFIFWNHPGWIAHQPDGIAKWYDEHTWLLDSAMMYGIEVVNERAYYPEVFQWALDKNLTMLSNSDVHDPVQMVWEINDADYRPITLVFSDDKSEAGIKKALFNGRTAVLYDNQLIGKEKYVSEIFNKSVSINKTSLFLKGRKRVNVMITNHSDIKFSLKSLKNTADLRFDKELVLPPQKTIILSIGAAEKNKSGNAEYSLAYEVENVKVAPTQNLKTNFKFNITFEPAE